MESNVLRGNFRLPLTIDEAVYLRGSIRRDVRGLKNGDERDFLNRILQRLEQMMFDDKYYQDIVF